MLSSSVLDVGWIDAVPHDRPTLIVAEGLLMYMQPSEVKALVLKLRECFPGSQLVCDVFGSLSTKVAPYTKAIKETGAEVGFWLDDAREIEQWGEGVRLVNEWYFPQAEDIRRLDMTERVVFKLMNIVPVLRRAHRIVQYQL